MRNTRQFGRLWFLFEQDGQVAEVQAVLNNWRTRNLTVKTGGFAIRIVDGVGIAQSYPCTESDTQAGGRLE